VGNKILIITITRNQSRALQGGVQSAERGLQQSYVQARWWLKIEGGKEYADRDIHEASLMLPSVETWLDILRVSTDPSKNRLLVHIGVSVTIILISYTVVNVKVRQCPVHFS
jgi:hypothetical protein